MTQRNNVGERGKGKPRESWQTTGRFHVWPHADGQTRPSQTRLGARRCHLGRCNQRRGARRMSAPIHFASSGCQRSGAWRHKQRERQRKMRACGGHPGHGREALEEQPLWGDKGRGQDRKKKSCFSEGNFGVFFHWHSGDGTRGPTSEWGSLLTLHSSVRFRLVGPFQGIPGQFACNFCRWRCRRRVSQQGTEALREQRLASSGNANVNKICLVSWCEEKTFEKLLKHRVWWSVYDTLCFLPKYCQFTDRSDSSASTCHLSSNIAQKKYNSIWNEAKKTHFKDCRS